MIYCRIDLSKTAYVELNNYKILDVSYYEQIKNIYKQYCAYKKFKSVIPIFYEELESQYNEVLGYYNNNELIAFSLINLYPTDRSAYAEQFAWNYENPKLRLGYESLKSECARYKRLGYKYLYIGEYNEYKTQFSGFEIVGTFNE